MNGVADAMIGVPHFRRDLRWHTDARSTGAAAP
jgi:hypothetical protein